MDYTAQTTLTDNAPLVLDSTCSTKKIWPKSATLRMDIRREVKPDIVASAAYLPFRNGMFSEIYCDPPHMIRTDTTEEAYQRYLNRKWVAHPRLIREKNGYVRIRDPGQKPRAVDLLRFGAWKNREEWLAFLDGINNEFARCLAKAGRVYFKLASGADKRMTKIEDMSRLSKFDEIHQKADESKAPWSNNLTYWLTLEPK